MEKLCLEHGLDFHEVIKWYDGYSLNGVTIHNPYSVIKAVNNRKCAACWKLTGSRQ